jgi:cytochrome c oxidase subunit 2
MKMKISSALILVVAASLALSACGNSTPASSPAAAPSSSAQQSGSGVKEIKLTATNYEFDQKEIHVKKGDKVKLTLDNKQGMHGIAIADFKVDLKKAGSVEFVADKAGTFEYACSVMCGAGHTEMKGKLVVE